jgi:hypothetical protein
MQSTKRCTVFLLGIHRLYTQTFPAKGPEMKDWFRDDEDRLLPLIEGRNIAEQCYNSDKSPDNTDKRTAARKTLKRALRDAKDKWLEKQIQMPRCYRTS